MGEEDLEVEGHGPFSRVGFDVELGAHSVDF